MNLDERCVLATVRRRRFWTHGDFLFLWTGQGVSEFGSQLTVVALQLIAVQKLEAGPTALGIINASRYIPFLFLSAIVGAWLDGTSKRRAMIAADVARASFILTIPILYWSGHLTISIIFISALAGGVGRVFFDVANQAVVSRIVDENEVVRANAALQNTISTARIAGPSAAGAIVQALGAPVALVLDGISYIVNSMALTRVRADAPVAGAKSSLLIQRIRTGMVIIRRNRYLPTLLLGSSVSECAYLAPRKARYCDGHFLLCDFYQHDADPTCGRPPTVRASLSVRRLYILGYRTRCLQRC